MSAGPLGTLLTLCAALVLSMGGLATFPAVVPDVRAAFGLSHTAAGWIAGSYHAGYMLAVPLLAALSDRVDARRIVSTSLAAAALVSAVFAFAAVGFWSALACQILGGMALAGIYMPGLKGLADRTGGTHQGRFIAFYTTSFTIGTSLSFVIAGLAAQRWGWRAAFAAAAIEQAAGALLVALALRPIVPVAEGRAPSGTPPPAFGARIRRRFGPVLASRETMDYILGYSAHMWELFALRAWMVPFFAFALSQGEGSPWNPQTVAAFVTILGVPASILGQEAAARLGPRRLITAVMLSASAISWLVGWTATLPFVVAVAACGLYNVAVSADSAPLTAAAVAAAPPGYRGAAMAVHSTLGFTAATLGTLAVGATLDAFGGDTPLAWGMAFGVMGVTNLLGAARLRLTAPARRATP